ncbi:single-stranded DNA-binding protein [Thalassobacillus sp. CUG 92003]|uniref:single-stranded DNA-binding protein n=1 Tax=Thalassobacillus sp. CUG 92003 TaxID=2736641 RepID=UPI0015E6AEF2|nr:single-stranded DNA-binding protein [Thalassobacillus sp. CUG 92003]
MGLRDNLKKREEKRDQAANGGINGDLPDGVTRYVRLGGQGSELGPEGKTFVMLRDPDLWFFYYVHEKSNFSPFELYIKKHTCLNSPRKAPETVEEAEQLFAKYEKPNPKVCISDAAEAKRVLYFMIPVYDPEYKTWRVIDTKEFHVMNILKGYDSIEKSAKKFNKEYSLIGDAFTIKKDDKTFMIEMGDLDDKVIEEAKPFMDEDIDYEELANFREESDIIEILRDAHPDHVNKDVLPDKQGDDPDDNTGSNEEVGEGADDTEEYPF